MAVTRTPIAATPAFALSALKLHARIDHDDDDAGLTLMGQTAAAEIEAYSELALLRQQISFVLDVPANEGMFVSLPIGPLAPEAEITINGLPFAGTVTAGRYPSLTLPDDITGTVTITYEAGYGDDLDDIPSDLQLAILDQAARLYDLRGVDDAKQGLSLAAARIAARYRKVTV